MGMNTEANWDKYYSDREAREDQRRRSKLLPGASTHLVTTMEGIVGRKMARRTPYWPGPGNATTESPLLIIPEGHIPYSFVDAFNTWVDNFNEQCIADGQSPGAQIAMVAVGENSYKLRAVS